MQKKLNLNKILVACCLCCFVTLATAQNTNTLETTQKTFLRGNFTEKLSAINTIPEDSDQYHSLVILASEYIIMCAPFFSDDIEFENLVAAVIKRCDPFQKKDFELLETMYTKIIDNTSKAPILIALTKVSPQPVEVTEKLVDYIDTIANNNYDGEDLKLALSIAADTKNIAFFPVLFKCYSNTSSENIKAISKEGIDNLNLTSEYKNSILAIINNNSTKDKQLILQLVTDNDKNSDFFKAEIAENIFKTVIKKVDSVSSPTPDFINLQLSTLTELVRFSWTRASILVEQFYEIAIEEYNNDLLTTDQFIQVINGYAQLAPTNASISLAVYLGEINTLFEENGTYSEPIMIAVTQTLGNLGNHAAFDNLLYTTYLNYSEEVLTAARDALIKLKW